MFDKGKIKGGSNDSPLLFWIGFKLEFETKEDTQIVELCSCFSN